MGSYDELRMYAEAFFDAQEARKAMKNKIRSAADPVFFEVAAKHYKAVEEEMSPAMILCLREIAPPGVLAWQKLEKGIGEHLLGRLLGRVGDVRIAIPKHWEGTGKKRILVAEDPRPRTAAQLRSYCGHGDPERKLHKNMTAEEVLAVGDPKIKSIVWNIAKACIRAGVRSYCEDEEFVPLGKPGTPEHLICALCGEKKQYHASISISRYGALYLARREQTEDYVHAKPCVRCGPKGKPAQIGTPWNKGHQLGDAQRVVGKEVLNDLWSAAE